MMPTDRTKQFGGAGVVASVRSSGGTTPSPAGAAEAQAKPQRRKSKSRDRGRRFGCGGGEMLGIVQRRVIPLRLPSVRWLPHRASRPRVPLLAVRRHYILPRLSSDATSIFSATVPIHHGLWGFLSRSRLAPFHVNCLFCPSKLFKIQYCKIGVALIFNV